MYNEKHHYAIRLKFGNKFLTSLTKSLLETKASICSTVKENLLLCPCHNLTYFCNKACVTKKLRLLEIINFRIEPLPFQNMHLNGAHSISDISLPCRFWIYIYVYIHTYIYVTLCTLVLLHAVVVHNIHLYIHYISYIILCMLYVCNL